MIFNKVDEVKIGIVGLGRFITSWTKIFKAHPKITYIAAADFSEEKRNNYKDYLDNVYSSLDEMLEKDKEINCILIFAQRHIHGSIAIQALKAGKHVLSAVPMGITFDEIKEITEIVDRTGLIYMMAETCYYWPSAVWAREKFKTGAFGSFVYGAAQYYHTIQDMFKAYDLDNPKSRMEVGIPPMYYAMHSISMLFSSIDDYATEVSCFGYEDKINPEFFGKGKNNWDNPFSNETAIFKMSKGGHGRINEFRRIGTIKPSSYISGIYGDDGCYEACGERHIFASSGKGPEPREQEGYICEDVSREINNLLYYKENPGFEKVTTEYRYHVGFSPCQNYKKLPKELIELCDKCIEEDDLSTPGHNGSHFLIVDDFVRCCLSGKQHPLNAWASARYCIPGIIAHDSAMQGGITLPIPDLGDMPDKFELMDYNDLEY